MVIACYLLYKFKNVHLLHMQGNIKKYIHELMFHRKKKHIELVKLCDPKQGTCRFEKEPEKCWFKHKDFLLATNRVAHGEDNQSVPLVQSAQIVQSVNTFQFVNSVPHIVK